MQFQVLGEQRKSQIISKYLESIAQYKVKAVQSGNNLNITIGNSTFRVDTTKREVVNSRNVLSR
jgi:hypothetical protein